MAKRLTEKQKDEIIKSFQDGKTVEILSQNLNFNKLTIVRHLKKILGESKYKEFNTRNKSIDLINKNKEINLKKDLELELKKSNTKPISFETQNENIIETDFSPDSSFFEIPPLDCEVDSSTQKDLSSIPISEMNFPKIG